jgi:hypothetical protein
MSEDIPPPCHGKLFPEIDRFELVVPDTVRIRISTVHFGI